MKRIKGLVAVVVAVVMVFAFAACGSSDTESAGEVNIYMWSDYLSDSVVESFEEETGITVNLSYMSTSEEAVAKITSGAGDEYDLVMPCDADLTSLIEGEYLETIDLDSLTNFSNLADIYTYREIDPDNEYAIPYLMNYVYVVYNTETCPIEITCYEDLLDESLVGEIASVTGVRNLFPIALVALGYDPNSTVESEIEEAYEWLEALLPNVAAFDSDNAETLLINGAASVAFLFDGQAGRAFDELGDTLQIAELTDSIQLGVDEFVIPAGAANKENAETFLNYILDADVMAQNLTDMMEETGSTYLCPNEAAVELMSDDYKEAPALSLSDEMKNNYFLQLDVSEAATVYDEYWTKLMSEVE